MAFSVSKYYSSGANALADLYKAIKRAGWQIYDDIGTEDKVFISSGEENKYPPVYIRIYYSGGYIRFYLYLYWNNVTHAGTVEAYDSSYINYSSGTYTFCGNKDTFGAGFKYERRVFFGFCNKLFYPEITNLTSSASAGSSVNLEVASSSGIVKGQRIQIVGVDYEGRDQLQVIDVPDGTHVTVLSLPRDYASGAFLGVTPCPAFITNADGNISFRPLCPYKNPHRGSTR